MGVECNISDMYHFGLQYEKHGLSQGDALACVQILCRVRQVRLYHGCAMSTSAKHLTFQKYCKCLEKGEGCVLHYSDFQVRCMWFMVIYSVQ